MRTLGYGRGNAALKGVVLRAAMAVVHGSTSAAEPTDAAQDLCSKEGLMRLAPEFRNAEGNFQVPDPSKDLHAFLAAHQGLSNAIDMLLARANLAGDPYAAAQRRHVPLRFGSHWRAAEVGIQTDGKSIGYVNTEFASYGGASFLDGLTSIEKSSGVFYAIQQDGAFPALIYPMPTALPCVNRLTLAAENTVGSWPAPSYAVGPAGGEAFLIVNICQDLGKPVSVAERTVLSPDAMLILAFQWADTPDMAAFKTDRKAHRH